MYLVPGTMNEEWRTPVQDWDSRMCQYLVSNDLPFALHLLRYGYVLPSFWLLCHTNMLIVGTETALK